MRTNSVSGYHIFIYGLSETVLAYKLSFDYYSMIFKKKKRASSLAEDFALKRNFRPFSLFQREELPPFVCRAIATIIEYCFIGSKRANLTNKPTDRAKNKPSPFIFMQIKVV